MTFKQPPSLRRSPVQRDQPLLWQHDEIGSCSKQLAGNLGQDTLTADERYVVVGELLV